MFYAHAMTGPEQGVMTIRAVCLDIAGVLTDSGRLLPGAREALQALDDAGLPWRLLTNTSRRPQSAILAELAGLGLSVSAAHLFAAPRVVAETLRRRGLRPLLLVHPDIRSEFSGVDCHDPDAVVLCDAAEGLDYRSLDIAFDLLMQGAPLLAVGMNRYFHGRERLELDAGPFVKALEYASGVTAEVIGKPGRAMFDLACASMGVSAADTVMIGDDVDADVLGALNAGLQGVLVRTGKYRCGDERRLPPEATCEADVLSAVKAMLRMN